MLEGVSWEGESPESGGVTVELVFAAVPVVEVAYELDRFGGWCPFADFPDIAVWAVVDTSDEVPVGEVIEAAMRRFYFLEVRVKYINAFVDLLSLGF